MGILKRKVCFSIITLANLESDDMNRTKKVISDAFWQLLEEKPYNKITVHNIVERCQVNRNTFYYHFSDIPALAEYTIKEWAEDIIHDNCEFGSPISCITPIVQECTKRKNACLHLYRSAHREAFMRYLSQISGHIISCYIEQAAAGLDIPAQDKTILNRFYKCTFSGIILDWLDSGMSYDLLEFCEKICESFAGSGKSAFLMYAGNQK